MKRIKFLAVILMAFILILSCSGCTLLQTSSMGDPAIWKAVDPQTGNTLYLFGSIHIAEESLYPLNDTIMDAYEACDYLAVEADLLSFGENTEQQMGLAGTLIYTDGRTVTDEIDEALVVEAAEIIKNADISLDVPISALNMFKPYIWISLLSEISTKKAGLYSADGVDIHFMKLAREDGKEILEIESVESQMALLTDFSVDIQNILFASALDIDAAAESTALLYKAWKTGDMDALLGEEAPDEEMDEALASALAEYNRLLLTDRNDLMSDTADTYLQEGKMVFFVVGARHMVGEDGIVEQLISKGYEVTRL